MELSAKPKKKMLSIFCCFSMNDKGRRKRKERLYSSMGNKTNITDQNISIKVNDFTNNLQPQQFINEKEKSIDIKQEIRNFQNNELLFLNKNNKDVYSTNYNNNKIKDNNDIVINNILNKTIEEKNTKMKLSMIFNNTNDNNYVNDNLNKLNPSNLKKNNFKKIILSNKEEGNIKDNNIRNKEEENINENNEDLLINPIPIKQYQTNIIDNSRNNNSILSNKKVCITNNYNPKNININIYDNNNGCIQSIKKNKPKPKNNKFDIRNEILLKNNYFKTYTINKAKETKKNELSKNNVNKSKNSNLNIIINNSNIINSNNNFNKKKISSKLNKNNNKIKNNYFRIITNYTIFQLINLTCFKNMLDNHYLDL